jgi:hypothetical protein
MTVAGTVGGVGSLTTRKARNLSPRGPYHLSGCKSPTVPALSR